MEEFLLKTQSQMDKLKDKTLLYIGSRTIVTTDEELDNSCWAALKKMGLKSLCLILHDSPINLRWCTKMKMLGIVDEFNVDGLVDEKIDDRPVDEVVAGIMNWLNERGIKVDACSFAGDFITMVGGYLCEALGVPGNSFESTKLAYLKDITQTVILKTPTAQQYGVLNFSVENEIELLAALDQTRFPVVMKPVVGSGSVGVKVLYDIESCKTYYAELCEGMERGTTACEKLAYSHSVIVMEFLQGTKYTIDVVISNGTLIGGSVYQRGPADLPYFWATTLTVPGDVTDKEHSELVEAAYQCCLAVGLQNGVYDVEFIRNGSETPKLIEINSRPGGHCLTDFFKASYGVDLMLLSHLMCCGFNISETDLKLEPRVHVAVHSFYLHRDGEPLTRAFGYMLAKAKDQQITMFSPGWQTTTEMIYEQSISIRQTLILMATSPISRKNAVEKLASFLVETKYYDNMQDALAHF